MNLKALLENPKFDQFIVGLIIVNSITLGLETSKGIVAATGSVLHILDRAILSVFVAELLMRLWVYRMKFFRDGWRNFDLFVVTLALIPAAGNLSVLRALRILRVLRLATMMPALRKVVGGLVVALPSVWAITLLLALIFYIFAIMTTNWYGEAFPDEFGSLGKSLYSLFQIMTLEGWSQHIVRPMLKAYPMAWMLFFFFIICTSFTILSLFIGIIILEVHKLDDEDDDDEAMQEMQDKQSRILEEIGALKKRIEESSDKN